MDKKTLILEGPNGIGKDTFINTFLKYCPDCRVHYAASGIVKEIIADLGEEALPIASYTAYETIYTSIKRDPSQSYHIQYRSMLTDYVYNKVFRENASLEKKDMEYLKKFLTEKYDKSFVFWVMTYQDHYLRKQVGFDNSEIDRRVRGRKEERSKIASINSVYRDTVIEIAHEYPSLNIVHTVGNGMLDPIKKIDEAVMDLQSIFKLKGINNPAISIVDLTCDKNFDGFWQYYDTRIPNKIFVVLANNEAKYKRFLESQQHKEFYIPIINPLPDVLFDDFFSIYVSYAIYERFGIMWFDTTEDRRSALRKLIEDSSGAQED